MTLGVGIIGCGNIAPIYMQNLAAFEETEVVGVTDLDPRRAEERAAQFGVRTFARTEDLLADPGVDLVLNLTTPDAHANVAQQALSAGKHVYNEKPLAIRREDGEEILRLAAEYGLRVGCAPDTFLGASHQTARDLIDSGAIGEPVAAQAFMQCHGHESWHPAPEFYYKEGGGPLFDMGPYYLTVLVALLGPVRRVTGSARATFARRLITSEPNRGEVIEVDVPTHIVGVLDFEGGPIAQITTSFDVWHHRMPHIEIYGSEGSLGLPDPNGFGGPVLIRGPQDETWREAPVTRPYADNARGLGVRDIALALAAARPHRASGALALHVLDVMHGILEASDLGRHVAIESRVERPDSMPG